MDQEAPRPAHVSLRFSPVDPGAAPAAGFAMAVVRGDGTWVLVDDATVELLGVPASTLVGGASLVHSVAPGDAAVLDDTLRGALEGRPATGVQIRLVRPDGHPVAVHLSASALTGATPRDPVTVGGEMAERLAQVRQDQTADWFERILADAPTVTVVADDDGTYEYVSPNIEQILGYPVSDFLGATFGRITHPDDKPEMTRCFQGVRAAGRAVCRFRVLHANGSWRWLEASVTDQRDDVRLRALVAHIRDVTETVGAEDALRHQATHDALTGLPNRTLLQDRLTSAIARSDRSGTTFALLFCDLDHFKRVNDTLGHDVGDALLLEVSERLGSRLRSTDTLARIGGDEFVVVIERLDPASAEVTARRVAGDLLEVLRAPVTVGDHVVSVSASVGITMHREGQSPANLLRDADVAMYAAKESGRARATVHDEIMRAATEHRFHMDGVLRRALTLGGVVVDYQPIVSLPDRRVLGAEALVRIEVDGVRYGPDAFIDAAEESGMIVPIGEEVLHAALEEAATWASGGEIAVNLSARQLASPRIVPLVLDTLAVTGVSPDRLVLEVTETALVESNDALDRKVARLAEAGVRIALDDFGTGWSSLSYLRMFPVSVVKIDRSFVQGVARIGSGDIEVIRAVIGLAAALGIDVVAEGIETDIQAAVLTQLGCTLGQGYLFGRPTADVPDALRDPAPLATSSSGLIVPGG